MMRELNKPSFNAYQDHVAALSVCFGLSVITFNVVRFWHNELDDALIYARYIQNLIEGHGLVYNVNERVNGLTSPLFAYLSILPSCITGDARDGIMVVSLFGCIASSIVSYLIVLEFGGDKLSASLPAVLTALSSITYKNLGMESSLFGFVVLLCFLAYFKGRLPSACVLVALAILVRPEGIFLAPTLLVINYIYRRPWPTVYCYIAPSLILISQLFFNFYYYGAVLSNSGLAKISQGTSGFWGDNAFLKVLIDNYDKGIRLTGAPLFANVLLLISVIPIFVGKTRALVQAFLVFLLFYTCFFSLYNIPPQAWYYGIYFNILWISVSLGMAWILVMLPLWMRNIFLVAFVAGLFIWQQPNNLSGFSQMYRDDYRKIGIWLSQNTPASASVAAIEIGTIGWYSKRHIIDILGLITAENASFVAMGDFNEWIKKNPPDYLVVHNPIMLFESVVGYVTEHRGPGRLDVVPGFELPGFMLYRYDYQPQ